MRSDQAASILDSIMAAWEWQMEPQTLELWTQALEKLDDAEAAELTVVELYMTWTRQQGRPRIGDITQHYGAVRRRLEGERVNQEPVAALPEPEVPPGTPAEVLALVNELRSEGLRGGDLVRAVLIRKGIESPKDVAHADAFDPPLTLAEARHSIHEKQRMHVDGCRFCRTQKEGPVQQEQAT